MVQRYNYWYTDNVYVGRCPSGMSPATHGEYTKYKDVAQDIADAQIFRQLVGRAQATGNSLQQLVLAAEREHEAKKVDRPRTLRLPERVKELLKFKEGKSQRLHVHSIPARQITRDNLNEPIVINWDVGGGMYASSDVDYLGPFPGDTAALWLEFDTDFKLVNAGYWNPAKTTVVWV